jgi:MFS family permease
VAAFALQSIDHVNRSFSPLLTMPGRPVYPTLYQFIPMLMLGLLIMSGMRIAICLVALAQQASPLRVGSLVAMFSIFPMLCAVPVGRWLDQVGMVLPLHLGAFCLCLGAGLILFLPQNPVFYLTAALSGIGYMLLHLVAAEKPN